MKGMMKCLNGEIHDGIKPIKGLQKLEDWFKGIKGARTHTYTQMVISLMYVMFLKEGRNLKIRTLSVEK